jgi:hypothetical protein
VSSWCVNIARSFSCLLLLSVNVFSCCFIWWVICCVMRSWTLMVNCWLFVMSSVLAGCTVMLSARKCDYRNINQVMRSVFEFVDLLLKNEASLLDWTSDTVSHFFSKNIIQKITIKNNTFTITYELMQV